MGEKKFKKIEVVFLIRRSCNMCIAIMNEISEYMISNIHINYNVVDLEDENCYFPKKKSSITPALWVDNKMWYAGVFDINKFDKKLNQMIN